MDTAIKSMKLGLLLVILGCGTGSSERAQTSIRSTAGSEVAVAANCPNDSTIDRFLTNWRERVPTGRIVEPEATIEDALCAQRKIVERLQRTLGRRVGYKAGLTNEAAQARFNVDEPVRGVLLEDMLLEDGALVPANFGARPQFEADLLVVVSDEAVNDAESPEAVLPYVSEVIPFIELPDLAVSEDQPINGSLLTAMNVAARLGVLGERVPVEQTSEFFQALADMTVRLTNGAGEEIESPQGSAVLGHPLNSLLWLRDSGVRFRSGDLVSVGSVGSLYPTEAGQTVTATYEGLPGNPSVSVRFE